MITFIFSHRYFQQKKSFIFSNGNTLQNGSDDYKFDVYVRNHLPQKYIKLSLKSYYI